MLHPEAVPLRMGDYAIAAGPRGSVVTRHTDALPAIASRMTPVYLRPHNVITLLGRDLELEALLRALENGEPVQYYGESGIGKTTLLRHLAYFPPNRAYPDGIVYLPARRMALSDLLQALYDVFYAGHPQVKPTEAHIRHALQSKRALLLLDDVEYPREDVEALLDFMPRSAWVLSSSHSTLEGIGRAVAVRGVPIAAGLSLIERELERPLTDEERQIAVAWCRELSGKPLRLVQAAARAREEQLPLTHLTLPEPEASPALTAWAAGLAELSAPQQQVLSLLAALNGAPLPVEHLAALAGGIDPTLLAVLQQRHLAQGHSPRYSVVGDLETVLPELWAADVAAWKDRLLAHFIAWTEAAETTSAQILAAEDALRQCLAWGCASRAWRETLRLSRALERVLAQAKRWGAWREVLESGLQAAQALGDPAAEAWALHQLGTRAGCLGEADARATLARALRLRESLGDADGAAITRQNYATFFGAPPPLPARPAPSRPWVWGGIAVALVIALIVGAQRWTAGRALPAVPPSSTPPPLATLPPTSTPTLTVTPSATPTPTRTATPTLTPTATPSPSPSLTPTATATLTRSSAPQLLAPEQGSTQGTRVTFRWRGAIQRAETVWQAYQVTARHVESGAVIQSGPLGETTWTADLPAERFGEWRWSVAIIEGNQAVATSAQWMFWMAPHSGAPAQPPSEPPPSGPTTPTPIPTVPFAWPTATPSPPPPG